ncbi:MAG TPA: alpha/beta hydrolase [Candidatus Megaira endosymbiont of Hartmannula sinica]|nr:alpha/beta hydrolase [Candidatus Megaera endosymbiont of Hartmannula sinica]
MKLITKFIIILQISLISCSKKGFNRQINIHSSKHNFKKELIQTKDFVLTSYQKITDKEKPIIFYIEGDGRAFNRHGQITKNPTPKHNTLFTLATIDKKENIVYLARPCQYTDISLNPICNNNLYWSNGRLSEKVISNINQAIKIIRNAVNSEKQTNRFSLVGFSGGGGVAILIAAQNPNIVKDIITIAGNLNHVKFNKYHKVSPMDKSLNPIDYSNIIKNIPQIHLSGGKDFIVPKFIAEEFTNKTNYTNKKNNKLICAKHIISKQSTHSNWSKYWEQNLEKLREEKLKCE